MSSSYTLHRPTPSYTHADHAWTVLCVVIARLGVCVAGCFTNPSGSTNTNTTQPPPHVVIITP